MSSFEVYTFHDRHNNTIRYLFNPSRRLNNSDESGPALLDQVTETFDPELDHLPSTQIPEPKAGAELFTYRARDGADVRYQFDPTAQNGKQYVVAIHREPSNWSTLREEDLAVDNEEELRRLYGEGPLSGMSAKRRDSGADVEMTTE
jgi:hypothetical protein